LITSPRSSVILYLLNQRGALILEKANYQITVEGLLDTRWSEWFEGWTVTPQEDGTTILASPLVDQAALHGVLTKIRDLNLSLLSVQNIETNSSTREKENNDKD
jgi:hypothetical protein